MRLNALALQLKLDSNPGGYPAMISPFPFTFTLEEFVAWYFRVKNWTVTFDINCDFEVLGVPYTVARTHTEIVDSIAGFADEARAVQDTYERAQPLDTAIPVFFINTEHQFSMFEVGPTFPYGPRGYWTGEQGGLPGNVIPRFRGGYGYNFDDALGEISPAGLGSVQIDTNSLEAYTPGPGIAVGSAAGVLTFFGQSVDMAWQISPRGGGSPVTNVVFNSLSLIITPNEYFEFSDGTNPVWDSVTGAPLRDPLNP